MPVCAPLALRVPDEVARRLRALHPALKARIKAALQTIREAPESGKPLRDDLAGLRSFRVSRHRIVYRVTEDPMVEIIPVGPRKTIYEETYRRLGKEAIEER